MYQKKGKNEMMTLYELSRELENFELEIDEETGEVLNGSELDALIMERDKKIENVAIMVKSLKAETEAYRNEKKKIDKRIKTSEAKAEWLSNYLQAMLGGDKFKSAVATITYRTDDVVVVDDMENVPEEYIKVKAEYSVDKMAVKKLLKNGENINGVHLEQSVSMQVK